LSAGDGDDLLIGGKGNDRLIGGRGTDTAQFDGSFDSYRFSFDANGRLVVRDISGLQGTDTLISIEKLRFGDVVVDVADVENALNALAIQPSVAENVWSEIPVSSLDSAEPISGDLPSEPTSADRPIVNAPHDTPVTAESTSQTNGEDGTQLGTTDWQDVDFGKLTEVAID
jgi:hypothetical protein